MSLLKLFHRLLIYAFVEEKFSDTLSIIDKKGKRVRKIKSNFFY